MVLTSAGSLYFADCPRNRFIPICLIVGGCVALLRGLENLCYLLMKAKSRPSVRSQDGGTGTEADGDLLVTLIHGLWYCFMLAWFLAGLFTHFIIKYIKVSPTFQLRPEIK